MLLFKIMSLTRKQIVLHNSAQRLLGIIGVRPLLCHAWQGRNLFCSGCLPGHIFKCSRCQLLLPWCRGSSDIFPDWCDDCVADYVKLEGFPR